VETGDGGGGEVERERGMDKVEMSEDDRWGLLIIESVV
jgi:hypothetical protein